MCKKEQGSQIRIDSIRIPWLDNAKGLGILCVMFCHVSWGVLDNPNNLIEHFINTFFMYLFFMVSGYVSYHSFFRLNTWGQLLRLKNYSLLFPLFFIGIPKIILQDYYEQGVLQRNPFVTMIVDPMMRGYWFLWYLFIIRLLGKIFKLVIEYAQIHLSRTMRIILYILLTCIGLILIKYFQYYPLFFLIGFLLHHKDYLNVLKTSDNIVGTAFMFFLIGFIICEISDMQIWFVRKFLLGLLFTPIVFIWASHTGTDSMLEKVFNLLGRYSLEIYVLHYFFLIGLSDSSLIQNLNMPEQGFLLNLLFYLMISIALIVFSLSVARVIHYNKLLELLLFGKVK
ncbi:Predicted membrane protein [Segatella buccae]|jgi:fucose 4-O-acetylase-like acetyltransferase|uniref:Predicted membrane protein n=1 Tax=Segatella buccae TaxID=28126 RepID=A0AAQ1ZLI0_9BACT|nr:acyltransferase family protein [Segatella buccae]SUB96798.1 Predicted membrane protein [Segatella buccae]